MQQSNQYPASRAAESVAESNGSTAGVDICGLEAQELCVGLDDCGEGLVEFPDGDVVF